MTLQLWTQIVGKVRLALTPWLNHGWHVPLYVTARGLETSPIPDRGATFDIELDFIAHELVVRTSRGERRRLALEPQTVADFYAKVMAVLDELHIAVTIKETPNEVPTSTSGNRAPISTTSFQVGIVVARGLVGLHRLAELGARLVAALPVMLGAAERLARGLSAGRADRWRGHGG